MGKTLYILVGSERTDCTDDAKKVADMRKSCGPTGTIHVWRFDEDADGRTIFQKLQGAEWPQWDPEFPGLKARPRAL